MSLNGSGEDTEPGSVRILREEEWEAGSEFIASAYRKEHWRATCPAGVWVRRCLWATVYIRKS